MKATMLTKMMKICFLLCTTFRSLYHKSTTIKQLEIGKHKVITTTNEHLSFADEEMKVGDFTMDLPIEEIRKSLVNKIASMDSTNTMMAENFSAKSSRNWY